MSRPPYNLNALRETVFGPYTDHELLHPKVKSTRSQQKFQLRSVVLFKDSVNRHIRVTGLNFTEYVLPPAEEPEKVKFVGKLVIESLNWLSEGGKALLQQALRTWDEKTNFKTAGSSHRFSGLTLDTLYGSRPGEGTQLTVYLVCEKNLSTTFMTSNTCSDGLLLHSKDKYRAYKILSMDVKTYSMSEKYLERWRIYHLVKELIESPGAPPIEDRTIHWLVAGAREKYLISNANRRHISATKEDEHHLGPRNMRHLSRAECESPFAEHSEWLLAQMLASNDARHRLLDMDEWLAYCRTAKRWRKNAKRHHVAWGGNEDSDCEETVIDQHTLTKYGGTSGDWENKLTNLVKRRKKKQKQAAEQRPPSPTVSDAVSNSPRRGDANYDSDFSDASTSSNSDSDYDSERDVDAESARLKYKVPPFCTIEPKLLPGRWIWHCPGPKCRYAINMLHLSEKNTERLAPKMADYLRGQWQDLSDPKVMTGFRQMVDMHNDEHMKKAGVLLVQRRDASGKFEPHVIQWPRKRARPVPRVTRSTVDVKAEQL